MKRRLLAVLAAAGIVGVLAALSGRSSYDSCCVTCGEWVHVTEWRVPLTGYIVATSSTTPEATPLSEALQKHGLVIETKHTWLFGAGSGAGSCATGEGEQVLDAVRSPRIAHFIDAIATYRSPAEARHWAQLILEPDTSWAASNTLHTAEIPASGFTDAAAFEQWWRRRSRDLDALDSLLE